MAKTIATVNLKEIRQMFADYKASEGCDCCRGSDHGDHLDAICKILKVKKYGDKSGYDLSLYRTKK